MGKYHVQGKTRGAAISGSGRRRLYQVVEAYACIVHVIGSPISSRIHRFIRGHTIAGSYWMNAQTKSSFEDSKKYYDRDRPIR